MEQFIMNNCKIANELRKYRDLTGCVNRAGLSDDPENYVEYVITRELSYMDMVTANAVYSLWRSGEGDNGFRAETIGQIMAGDMDRRLRPEKQDEIEERLQKLAGTELYIIPGKDRTGDHLQRPGGGGVRSGRPGPRLADGPAPARGWSLSHGYTERKEEEAVEDFERPAPLRGEEAKYAAAWLEELRRRLDDLYDQMPEDFNGVKFECWIERCAELSRQIDLLEEALRS